MPIKNAGPYLAECLASIQNQTEQNWEVLAVDDGCIDNSIQVFNAFAKQDERFKLFTNQETGIIPALRLAYSESSGAFVTRMDADDIMPEDKLETLKRYLLENGKRHLATGLVKYFAKGGVKPGYQFYENWLNTLTQSGNNYSDIYKECVIPSPCWMAYREDLDACGAFNSDEYPEDYDLTFRMMEYGLKVIPSDKILHLWRDHGGRTSRNHPNYADNRFLELKLDWFVKLTYDPTKTLVIWGAAQKGKICARRLLAAGVPFRWMCNNPNKINKSVYETLIENVKEIHSIPNKQVIVVVANKDQQAEIRSQLTEEEAFFFC